VDPPPHPDGEPPVPPIEPPGPGWTAQPSPPPYPPPPYAPGPDPQPWGQPTYPAGYPYAPQEPPKTGTNGFAIAALIFGILPICFLGVIFAIVALVQTSKSGQKGKGMAIAGLVLSVLWLAGIVTAGVISTLNDADRDSSGTITKSGEIDVTELKVGDCFNGLDNVKYGDPIHTLDGVPCSKLHQGEVFAEAPIPGSTYPGQATLQRSGQAPCVAKLKAVAPEHFKAQDIGVVWIYPEKRSWAEGNHHYACVAVGVGRRTGSITD